MDRENLLEQIGGARSANETSTAIYAGRAWLADHPEDGSVVSAIGDLIEIERESLSLQA